MDSKTKMEFEIGRLAKQSSWVIFLLGVFLIFASLNAFKQWQTADTTYNSIAVTGTGQSVSVPDIATFSFSVSADASDVATAQASVTKNTDAILADLKTLGIASTDIQTTDYEVYPKYTYEQTVCNGVAGEPCIPSRQIPDGYTVSQSISVKVRTTANAGQALAIAGKDGATNISGLSFTADDPNAATDAARALAIADAKTRAQTLAKSLGVALVRVVGYSDNGNSNPMPIMFNATAGASALSAPAPTIPVGQNTVTANVTVTYEIR